MHSSFLLLFQISEGVQNRAVPSLRTAQVYTAPAFFLFLLALPEPAAPQTNPQTGRDLQLQPRRLLHQIRWGNGHMCWWRWVSAAKISACLHVQGSLSPKENKHLKHNSSDDCVKEKCFVDFKLNCITDHTISKIGDIGDNISNIKIFKGCTRDWIKPSVDGFWWKPHTSNRFGVFLTETSFPSSN